MKLFQFRCTYKFVPGFVFAILACSLLGPISNAQIPGAAFSGLDNDAVVIPSTLAGRLAQSDVVMMAELKSLDELAILNVTKVLRGETKVAVDDEIVVALGLHENGKKNFVLFRDAASGKAGLGDWYILAIPKKDESYVSFLVNTEATGAKRLTHFLKYLDHESESIANDAHSEFHTASDEDLIALKEHYDTGALSTWIREPDISFDRKQLYLAMLGIVGDPSDARWIEDVLKTKRGLTTQTLGPMVATYLSIKGQDGLSFINETFLGPKSNAKDLRQVVKVLRHYSRLETSPITDQDIVNSLRLVLDRPEVADVVIPDLIAFKDWASADKIAELFASSRSSSRFRPAGAAFMARCPLSIAKLYLEEFKKIDAPAVEQSSKVKFRAAEHRYIGVKKDVVGIPTRRFMRVYVSKDWKLMGC